MVACHKNHHVKCRRIVRMLIHPTSVRIRPITQTQFFIVSSVRTSYSIRYKTDPNILQTPEKWHEAGSILGVHKYRVPPIKILAPEIYASLCIPLTYTLWERLCISSDSQRQLQKIRRVRKNKEPLHHFWTRLPVSQTSTPKSSHDLFATAWYKMKLTLEIQYKMIFTLKRQLENLDQMTSVSQASPEGEKGEWDKKKRSSGEEEKEEKWPHSLHTQLLGAVHWRGYQACNVPTVNNQRRLTL